MGKVIGEWNPTPPDDPPFKRGANPDDVNRPSPTNRDTCEVTGGEDSPLTKEQLKNLLTDFLDELPTSKPPAPARLDQQRRGDDQQPKQDGPTMEELYRALQEGGKEKVSQMMIVKGKTMIPSPEDLCLAYRDGGSEMLEALMANMDGDEDGPDPEWNERRWR